MPQITLATPVEPVHEEAVKPKTKRKARGHHFLLKKRVAVPVLAIFTIVGGIYGAETLLKQNNLSISANGIGVSESAETKPDFRAVLPDNSSIGELGGWKRISPPGASAVYAYADEIDGVPVSISEQELPSTFKGRADDQVAELARKFNATSKIDSEGVTLYVGTSAKGPQSAIMTKSNLLIMIKSQKKIANESWATYAKSLR